MEKSNLVDIFGLTGDAVSDERLDDLLSRLESDVQKPERAEIIVFKASQFLMRFGKGPEGVIIF
jgi:hypothetical protein